MSSRLSTTQNSFNKITSSYGKNRDPKGKVTYYHGEFRAYGYSVNTVLQGVTK